MLSSRSHPHTFQERLDAQKVALEQKAADHKPGPVRENLLKKARQIDVATHINEWLTSPGLQPPR